MNKDPGPGSIRIETCGEYHIVGNNDYAFAVNLNDPNDCHYFTRDPEVNNDAFIRACGWAYEPDDDIENDGDEGELIKYLVSQGKHVLVSSIGNIKKVKKVLKTREEALCFFHFFYPKNEDEHLWVEPFLYF